MEKFICICFFVLMNSAVFSQGQLGSYFFLKDQTGGDIKSVPATIEETAYFFHYEYLTALLFGKSGKLVGSQRCRLNLKDSRIFYLNEQGGDMELLSPIKRIEFILPDDSKAIFETAFTGSDLLSPKKFYQILTEGKVWLLQDTKFAEATRAIYGSAAVQAFDKVYEFYYYTGTKSDKIKNTEGLVNVFFDKWAQVNAFIKKEKIKARKQEDLKKVFEYYNALQ